MTPISISASMYYGTKAKANDTFKLILGLGPVNTA
jgi:hypothetical protein